MNALAYTCSKNDLPATSVVHNEISAYPPACHDSALVRPELGSWATSALKALLAGLDSLAHGMAIYDAAGELRYANTEAHSVLARWKECATHRSSGSHLRWTQALRRVCGQELRELFEIPDSGATRYVALVPVVIQGQCFAFVTFGRDELCGSIELQMFSTRYGLSPAESQVLEQLCRGMKSAQIARAHGVADSTVLTQISAIRNKTLFSSVRDLLRSLSTMPPLNPIVALRKCPGFRADGLGRELSNDRGQFAK